MKLNYRKDPVVISRLKIDDSKLTYNYMLNKSPQPLYNTCNCLISSKLILINRTKFEVNRNKFKINGKNEEAFR